MKKLPLIIFSILCFCALVCSYNSFKSAESLVRKDLGKALQQTIAIKGAEAMRQDSIKAYNALAMNNVEDVTITIYDNVLRENLSIPSLKTKAYIAYDIKQKNGKLNVSFRSGASCSFAMIFGISNQLLPAAFSLFALMSLLLSLRKKHSPNRISVGGIWLDKSCGKFKTMNNEPLHLTPMQHELMEMFYEAENHTLTKQDICERLWPKKPDANDTLYTLIRRMKPIVEANGRLKIECDRGKSYTLKINDVD